MRFQDYEREHEQNRVREDMLRRVAEREWLLPNKLGLLSIRVHPYQSSASLGGPAEVYINYSRWIDQPGSTYKLSGCSFEVKDGYFDHVHNAIGSLPLEQLAYVLQARSLIDQWIKGEHNELALQPFV